MTNILSIFAFLGDLFKIWIHTLFIVPFENWDMLWLLVPIWLAWFFAEFFQEKIGTSMGNAITNAVVILWGSIDCSRQTVNLIVRKSITSIFEIITRFFLVLMLFIYGFLIIHFGIKGNPIIKKIGRVRNITYVFAMFVPIFYNAIPFSINHLFAAILFFPIFYYFIEVVDRIVPNPKAIEEDLKKSNFASSPKKEMPHKDLISPNRQNTHSTHNTSHQNISYPNFHTGNPSTISRSQNSSNMPKHDEYQHHYLKK